MTVLTHAQVLGYAIAAGWARPNANMITVIANYESGDNPNNIGDQTLSKYGSIGLTQDFTGAHNPAELGLGSGAWTQELVNKLKDPLINMKAALIIFHEQGFSAWSTYNNLHTTAAWTTLLATVTNLTPVAPGANPPPSGGGTVTTTYPDAVAVAKQRIANKTKIGPNLCLVAVREAFGLSADGHEPTAYAAWLAEGGPTGPNAHAGHQPHPIPANVPVFFKDRNPDGHIAIADGMGRVYTTDFNGTHWVDDGHTYLVSIQSITTNGGMQYLGWTETLEGKRIHAHVSA